MNEATKFILVAEDDKFYGNIFKTKLTKEGYEVIVAVNGQEALTAAKAKKPDLILCDLIMPVMDGFETLKALKADPVLKTVKVLVLSNLGQDADIEKAKALGADDFFVKADLSIQDVVAKIKENL